MNFFKHQDEARKRTAQLILLFGLAITSLVLVTAFFVGSFVYFFESHATSMQAVDTYNTSLKTHVFRLVHSSHILWIVGGVAAVVSLGVVLKLSELKRGGAFVAETLGGRLLLDSESESEQKLLNIVEEMAIASGTPVPRVYVLADQAINAFAAGYTSSNAVIGVTKGALEKFNREEMQGVIAHEFSHIQNGDMRLNMRLLAILNGIMFIGHVGELLARSSHRSYSSRGKNRNQLALMGIGLIVIGYCGTFFGNLIKSAVSRQREFLADASAVQYTRNPQGIARALFKIKQHVFGSTLESEAAAEYSHFYFSSGVKSFLSRLFATHPEIDTRIARIYPKGFDFSIEQTSRETSKEEIQKAPIPNSDILSTNPIRSALTDTAAAMGFTSTQALENSISLRQDIQPLHDASRDSYRARVLCYSFLIDAKPEQAKGQIAFLKQTLHAVSFSEFEQLFSQFKRLNVKQQFALLQTTAPALRGLSKIQRENFLNICKALITFDKRISVKEWATYNLLQTTLSNIRIDSSLALNECGDEAKQLIRFVAQLNPETSRHKAYDSAVMSLNFDLDYSDASASNHEGSHYPPLPGAKDLDRGMHKLKQLKPLEKPRLIKALHICASFDEHISINEHLVLRSIGASLDCPIPLED